MNDINSKEINQALSVRHPMYIGGEVLAVLLVLEFIGVIVSHAFHWPWWIGSQLPVAYLLWQWSRERRFAYRLGLAWNRKREAEVELSRQLREALRRNEDPA